MSTKFGKFLRKLREDRGLTLREVEKKVKISNAYLSQLESGQRKGIPNYRTLKKLSGAYGTSVNDLVKYAEEGMDKMNIKILSPDAKFISQGYESLNEEGKLALKNYLQFLRKEKGKSKK